MNMDAFVEVALDNVEDRNHSAVNHIIKNMSSKDADKSKEAVLADIRSNWGSDRKMVFLHLFYNVRVSLIRLSSTIIKFHLNP